MPSTFKQVDRKPDSGDRLGLIVQTAASLFACSAAVAFYLLRGVGGSLHEFGVVMGPPASAGLLFVGASLGFPNLLAPGRLEFPLNLTLPFVFAVLTRVSVVLWASPQSAAFAPFDPMLPALVWTQAGPLVVAALLQCAVLSAVVAKNSR